MRKTDLVVFVFRFLFAILHVSEDIQSFFNMTFYLNVFCHVQFCMRRGFVAIVTHHLVSTLSQFNCKNCSLRDCAPCANEQVHQHQLYCAFEVVAVIGHIYSALYILIYCSHATTLMYALYTADTHAYEQRQHSRANVACQQVTSS